MQNNKIYAVETYAKAFFLLLIAKHSATLFLNPFPIPISHNEIHEIIESMVTQMPYVSFPKYVIVKGIIYKLSKIERPFPKKEDTSCIRRFFVLFFESKS
jgi:hypothetical protein